MTRKIRYQSYQPDPEGPTYGKVGDPVDMMNSQIFAHQHVEIVTRDFLMAGSPAAQVAGLNYTLPGGLSVSIASGQAVSVTGLSHETLPLGQASLVVLGAAHASLPRIDLVYALLETDAQAEIVYRPYRQLRTEAELSDDVPPYDPDQINQASQEQTRATILVRAGTPNAVPVAPAANANEVPLYQVRVNAGAVNLVAGNVTDVRNKIRSLRDAWVGIDTINAVVAQLDNNYVNIAGDTMTGHLTLPSNGLAVGTTELVVAGGKVVIGGASASGANKKGHVNGGLSVSSSYSATDTPANGLAVQGDEVIGGKLTSYNGQATGGIGQPIIKAQVNLNGSAAIPLTTLFTGAPDQAVYRVSVHIVLFGQGSAGTIAVNFKYADERVTRTVEVTSMSASVLYSHGEGTIIARAAPSPIQYEVVYTGVTGDPTWFLHIIVEQISQ